MGIDKIFEKLGMSRPEADEPEENLEEIKAVPKKQDETEEVPPATGRQAKAEYGEAGAPRGSNVVNISGSGASIRENSGGSLHGVHSSSAHNAGGNMKVVVIQPRSLDDSQQIANCLKEKRPVVINFEGVDDQLYRRILDFVSGTTYALDGNVNSISTRVWLFSPKNVNVSVSKQTNQGFTDMPWENK
ncbi:cell division protein SepF [Anaerovibrio sp.]|uniref:cell division protein SepF n=1 Tax=Anaerovibrio sp. TaxID=1872532 RepID=UPI003F17C896